MKKFTILSVMHIIAFKSFELSPWPRVRASQASLPCGPLVRHIYPSLVLVQPRKTRPNITERLLMGRKESNQTNKLSPFSSII